MLARLGFARRDDTGAKFDPARHDAVASAADRGAPPGMVVEVVRPGYGDGEHQLRPAQVVVAAADDGEAGLMAEGRDFYGFGVPRSASQDEIQQAYRKLARTYHPDVNYDPAAEERFKESPRPMPCCQIRGPGAATTPSARTSVRCPRTWTRTRSAAAAGGSDQRVARGGQACGFGPGMGDIDLDDLLGGLFGGSTGRGWGPIPGADQEAELELTVEEAYRGGQRTVTLQGPEGRRTFDVRCRPGVTDGQRIRLAGQGGHGGDGAPPGDLYFIVRIAPHPTIPGRRPRYLRRPAARAVGGRPGPRSPWNPRR